MAVLINSITMPADCKDCRFFDDYGDYPTCGITGYSKGYSWTPRHQRMENCPLLEIPEHKGLIDKHLLLRKRGDMTIKCSECPDKAFCLARLNDPTISGCGMPLYSRGMIRLEEVLVIHTIKVLENMKCDE